MNKERERGAALPREASAQAVGLVAPFLKEGGG